MGKLTVFISHITEEHEPVRLLKELIERKFLRSVQVFVSSHEDSVRLGDQWLGVIKSSLETCAAMIVICSPVSVARPWINFEAGAGWVRGIPVIPMCHSGIRPSELPAPLSSLQGGLLGDETGIQKLLARLAKIADMDIPTLDNSEFFQRMREFETSTRTNILIKDSALISSLLDRHIQRLEYCIFISTQGYKSFRELGDSELNIENYNFTFNDIYHLFSRSIVPLTLDKKIYDVFNETVERTAAAIQFVLSHGHLRIAPDLEELMNDFLLSLEHLDVWPDMVRIADRSPEEPKDENNLREMMISMIKSEPLPPTRKPHNAINYFIDYYEHLIFCAQWIGRFKSTMGRLTGRS